VKTLAQILFALLIGLLGCNRASNGANTNVEDPKLTDTRARDASDIKTLEERFTTAFRAKDVNAIMQLCVPDDSLHIFDVQPPREVKGRAAYRRVTDCLKKINGVWLIAHSHVSFPVDTRTGEADMQSKP